MELSEYLFWDIDKSSLDYEKHARWIIERVCTRGDLPDWHDIKSYYGLEKIKEEALQIKTLDKKTLNFLSFVFKVPIEKFRCYEHTYSENSYWIY